MLTPSGGGDHVALVDCMINSQAHSDAHCRYTCESFKSPNYSLYFFVYFALAVSVLSWRGVRAKSYRIRLEIFNVTADDLSTVNGWHRTQTPTKKKQKKTRGKNKKR